MAPGPRAAPAASRVACGSTRAGGRRKLRGRHPGAPAPAHQRSSVHPRLVVAADGRLGLHGVPDGDDGERARRPRGCRGARAAPRSRSSSGCTPSHTAPRPSTAASIRMFSVAAEQSWTHICGHLQLLGVAAHDEGDRGLGQPSRRRGGSRAPRPASRGRARRRSSTAAGCRPTAPPWPPAAAAPRARRTRARAVYLRMLRRLKTGSSMSTSRCGRSPPRRLSGRAGGDKPARDARTGRAGGSAGPAEPPALPVSRARSRSGCAAGTGRRHFLTIVIWKSGCGSGDGVSQGRT